MDEQETDARKTCETQGWPIVEVYRESQSASRFATRDRPELRRLLADVGADRFDVLVMWESSRWTRELETGGRLLNTFRDHGVTVHVVTHGRTYDPANARDWRSLADDLVDSGFESEKISTRTKRALAANALAGKPHGRPAYGYQRRYDPVTRALLAQEPHPDQAPIVREIYARVATCEPLVAIAEDLTARGVPSATGQGWRRAIIRKIATSHIYAGRREWRGEILEGNWPPLVTEDQWLAARRILTDPVRTTTTRPGRQRWLLSYLVVCSECDAALVASQNRQQGRKRYQCPTGHVSAYIDPFDEYVSEIVIAWLSQAANYARITDSGDDTEVTAARADAARLTSRLEEWRDSAATGETTPQSLARIEGKLLAEIAAAERRAAQAAMPLTVRALVSADVAVRDQWAALHVSGRREIIRALFARVALRPAVNGRLTDPGRVSLEWR